MRAHFGAAMTRHPPSPRLVTPSCRLGRRLVLLGAASLALPSSARAQPATLVPLKLDAPEAAPLLARLRQGGLVLFFRHADTLGEPCDRTYRIGDRPGQRNLSGRGREQARAIGRALERLGVPVERPVLAGPVFRARDTAELAFGVEAVEVTDALLADDYAGARLADVLDGHRRLFAEPVARGVNRVLVGHRTPGILVTDGQLGGRVFPEGAAAVFEPLGAAGFRLLAVVMPAPIEGAGFHGC